MAGHQFISYSRVDGEGVALNLCDNLEAGPPSVQVWLDQRHIRTGQNWDDEIAQAIRTCESLLFVMTPDSVAATSVCKNEWTLALRYKKPITPLLAHPEAEMPFQLINRQYIDFTGNGDQALAELRRHLRWLSSPEGVLRALQDRLADARRDLQRVSDPQQAQQEQRIQKDIADLDEQIRLQQAVVDDPEAAQRQTQDSIDFRMQAARHPARPSVAYLEPRSSILPQP